MTEPEYVETKVPNSEVEHVQLPQEDIERDRAIFQRIEVDAQELNYDLLESELKMVIGNTTYDSLSKVGYLLAIATSAQTREGILRAYQELYAREHIINLSELACVGMSLELQGTLLEKGVQTHIIAGESPEPSLLNKRAHDLIPYGHTLLLSHSTTGSYLLDPGAIIPEPLAFNPEAETSKSIGDRKYIVYPQTSRGGLFSHRLVVLREKEGTSTKVRGQDHNGFSYYFGFSFNPDRAILNPGNIIGMDTIRGYRNLRLASHDRNGQKKGYLIFDILSGEVNLGLYERSSLISQPEAVKIEKRIGVTDLLGDKQLMKDLSETFRTQIGLEDSLALLSDMRLDYISQILFPSVRGDIES